uniref:Ribosomal RNA-processing protein 8 n=1 Tax=Brugia pahangi TaxID=6280 RepID=A0A0N4T9P5_BRUPA
LPLDIFFSFLYRSYGLAATPRVRFLKRVANKQNLQATISQKQGEKSAEELVEMMISSAKGGKKAMESDEDDSNNEDDNIEDEEIDLGLGTSENNEAKENQSDFNLTASGSGLDEGSDDFLKIIRKNVFNIFPDKIDEVPEETKRESRKPVTRHALARKILKKGVKLGVKKVFTDDGMEIVENKLFPATVSNDDELVGLDVDEARRQMVQIDQIDKMTYKEKQKINLIYIGFSSCFLRFISQVRISIDRFTRGKVRLQFLLDSVYFFFVKKKKEKQKDKIKKLQNKEGGAILDLGAEGSGSDDGEADLSWLPDPDRPKKYDKEWNEKDMDGNANDNSEMKSIRRRKRKLLDDEERALALLLNFAYVVNCELFSSLLRSEGILQSKMAEPYKPAARIMSDKMEKRFSKDVLYWRRVERLAVFQEPGNITSTFFSPTDSNMVASTSSVKVFFFFYTLLLSVYL